MPSSFMKFPLDDGTNIAWTASTDMIETTAFTARPDETWEHIDSNGHAVTWANAQWVETDRWTVYDEDETWEDYTGEYRCPECGEVVEPAWTGDSSGPTFVQGLKHLTGTLELSLDAMPPDLGAVLALPVGDKTVNALVRSVQANGQTWVVEVEATGKPT